MLKELFEAIQKEAEAITKRALPTRFEVPGVADTVFFTHNGELHEKPVDLPVRNHFVASIADVKELLSKNKGNEADADQRLSVWISEEQIVVILDSDKHRKNKVTMKLVKSYLFQFIARLMNGSNAFSQGDMIRILRHELRNAGGQAEMLRAVRSVKFTTNESTASTIDRSQDSLGKVVDEQVAFGDGAELPEILRLTANIFRNPGETLADVEGEDFDISVEVDIPNKRFLLRVMEDEVHQKVIDVLKQLAETIGIEYPKVPIYFGTP